MVSKVAFTSPLVRDVVPALEPGTPIESGETGERAVLE